MSERDAAARMQLEELEKRIQGLRAAHLDEPPKAPRKKLRSPRPLSRRGRLAVRGFLALILVALCFEVVASCQEHREEGRAAEWREKAESELSESWTPEDGRRWLERNGFEVVLWNPHSARGWVAYAYPRGDDPWLVVEGRKLLSRKGFFFDESWVALRFHYELDGRSRGVTAAVRRLRLPDAGEDR